jgi:MFS family permease
MRLRRSTTHTPVTAPGPAIRLGLRENLGAFTLLVIVNAFVGAMVGMERTVLPLLAQEEFGLASRASILQFLVAFGVVKALANIVAGGASDRWGRRNILLLGWIAGLPVPFMILFAPSWDWVVAANVLLGINQGLCWSAAVVMKIDLAGPRQRGLAIGLNESAGYLAVSLAALVSGFLAAEYGLRPMPFVVGIAAAVAGLVLSLFVKETRAFTAIESGVQVSGPSGPSSMRDIFRRVSWKNPSLRAVSQAGLVNNLNDGAGWGLFPILFASLGADLREIAVLVATYPAVWGLGQVAAGHLSDRWSRKWIMVAGMAIQGAALLGVAVFDGFAAWLSCMIALGVGTALVYPTFLGAVSDHTSPDWRASAIGVYRFWRDLGYAAGAVAAGMAADYIGVSGSIGLVGVLTLVSGLIIATTYRHPADTVLLTGHAAGMPTPKGTV